MFDRKSFEEVGFLPTVYNLGLGDDDETCYNLIKNGKRVVFTPSTLCYHNHRTTFKKLFTEDELKKEQTKNIKLFKERCPKL
jgi:GT2 family glycosyltransferase